MAKYITKLISGETMYYLKDSEARESLGNKVDTTDSRLSDARPASNTVDTYSSTGTDPVSGKAVAAAIGTLDVSSVGGTNKYIKTISETNGKISATAGTVDTSVTADSSNLITSGAVKAAIDALPEPMVFKGSLGTGGTVTSLPTAAAANKGFTYKVITAGTYASQAAKVGDTFISDGSSWVLIPSGDEPSGTVTSVTIKATSPISIDSSAAITSSGTRTISHAASGVTAGTYKSVTVDAKGHVTAGTNPTTLAGYGITDAKIASGTITLGSNTITPLTSHQTTETIATNLTTAGYKLTDTNTKVTSAANHYAPTADASSELTATISGTAGAYAKDTEYTVLTGVKAQRDAKGHVTGITYTALKIKDTNTNTTYSDFVGSGSSAAHGLVPKPSTTAGTAKFLREDATWATPAYLTIGTTSTTAAAGNHTHDARYMSLVGGAGTAITSETDLNTILTAGTYYCPSSSVAGTLINTPHTSSNFKLVVQYDGSASYGRQIVYVYTGATYVRSISNKAVSGSWKQVAYDVPSWALKSSKPSYAFSEITDKPDFYTKKYNTKKLTSASWYRVANITQYGHTYLMSIGEAYNNGNPTASTFLLNIGYSAATITQIDRACKEPANIDSIRLVKYDNGTYYVDVHYKNTNTSGNTEYINIVNLSRENSTSGFRIVDWTAVSSLATGETVAASADVSQTLNADTVGGFTVGKSVPSTAVFTDAYVAQSASTTAFWRKVLLNYNTNTNSGDAVVSDTGIVYSAVGVSVQPSTGTLAATKFSGDISGCTGLTSSQIPSLAASKITSGTFAAARIPDLSGTYATSSRASTLEGYFTDGRANTANQLVYGVSYDGGKGVTNPYHLVGEVTVIGTSSRNTTAAFFVDSYYNNARGILVVQGRVDSGSTTINSSDTWAKWIVKDPNVKLDNFILTAKATSSSLVCRLYHKITAQWEHARFRLIDEGAWAGSTRLWQLFTTSSDTAGDYIMRAIPSDETQFVSVDATIFSGATSSAAGKAGSVPAPAKGKQTSFLRGDGTWAVPTDTNTTYSAGTGLSLSGTTFSLALTKALVTGALGYTPPTTNTTYSAFTGATADTAGTAGLVPAPAKGKQTSFLRGDGTWVVPTNTDTKVTCTSTEPTTSATWYALCTTSSTTVTGTAVTNPEIRYVVLEGTDSAAGYSRLCLGNTTASGTAGNKTGSILMYGSAGKYAHIVPHSGDTTNRTLYTPKTSGTLVAHTTDTAIGSATQPVYVTAAGAATAIDYTIEANVPSGAKFTDTTYSAGTLALFNTGTDTAQRVWSAKVLKSIGGKYLPLAGGTMTGSVDFGNNSISGVNDIDGMIHFIHYPNPTTPTNDSYACRVSYKNNNNRYLEIINSTSARGLQYYDSNNEGNLWMLYKADGDTLYVGDTAVVTTVRGENTRLLCYDGSAAHYCFLANKQGNACIGEYANRDYTYKLNVIGAVGATGYNNTSDIRKKDIIENVDLNVEDIANAPIFKFLWLDPEMDRGVNVGSSAQYWQTILPEIVSEADDDEKTLSMQYGVAALTSSVTLAKKVVEQEKTIKAQEERIKALEDAILEILSKLNN